MTKPTQLMRMILFRGMAAAFIATFLVLGILPRVLAGGAPAAPSDDPYMIGFGACTSDDAECNREIDRQCAAAGSKTRRDFLRRWTPRRTVCELRGGGVANCCIGACENGDIKKCF